MIHSTILKVIYKPFIILHKYEFIIQVSLELYSEMELLFWGENLILLYLHH